MAVVAGRMLLSSRRDILRKENLFLSISTLPIWSERVRFFETQNVEKFSVHVESSCDHHAENFFAQNLKKFMNSSKNFFSQTVPPQT